MDVNKLLEVYETYKQDNHKWQRIGEAMNATPERCRSKFRRLKAKGKVPSVAVADPVADPVADTGEKLVLDIDKLYPGLKFKFGIVSDTHIGSCHERLDVLQAAYEMFKRSGVKEVFLAGNIIDGCNNYNQFELKIPNGIDNQVEYLLNVYPQIGGINTYFIEGGCHSGQLFKREGIKIGKQIENTALNKGITTLKYLDYQEADVEFKTTNGRSIMKIIHPGGGSCYAISYRPQKIVESFSGGAKPNILIVGHYHKAGYFFVRNVHVLLAGCTQSQTTFMRSKSIEAHLGFWIVEVEFDVKGVISSFAPKFYAFFDEDYYQNYYISKSFTVEQCK